MKHIDQKASIISGKHIGIYRLHVLISGCELEGKGLKRRGMSALQVLKRELGIKGNRETVLEAARFTAANVASW